MRKIWTIVLSAATVLCVGATSAFAVNVGQGEKTAAGAEAAASGEITGVIQTADAGRISCNHADTDHDGICDDCGEACGNPVTATGTSVYGHHHGGGHHGHGGHGCGR